MKDPDVIVVGAGLAGLVATHELSKSGKRVLVIDQENRNNLGGQAWWSLAGLFFVNSPEQRRAGIRDSYDLALADWLGSARFDREEDHWPRKWAEAYVRFAATGKRGYLRDLGLRVLPMPGWAERGEGKAGGHGNSVPRFHMTWGVGPELVRVFQEPVERAEQHGLVEFAFRHRVDELIIESDAVVGVRGSVLESCDDLDRGVASSRTEVDDFELRASAVIVTSGGIGHDFDAIRQNWPVDRLGEPPEHMIAGVPAYVDGRMLDASEQVGASLINRDRMWHYPEGIHNWDPVWPNHAIRIIAGPSSIWLDANGNRLEAPNYPGFDALGSLTRVLSTGHDYSWFILNQTIIAREFALSGSEQNPDAADKDLRGFVRSRLSRQATGPVEAFKQNGVDFVVSDTVEDLVDKMNGISRGPLLDAGQVGETIRQRDRDVNHKYGKDLQLMAIRNARSYRPERTRIAKPHEILDADHGPLIAVRLNVCTRKTLGGLETNLDSQVLRPDGSPFPGLYAAGEVAGFGGGGVHGYNALEGTFVGGCIFSGLSAGRALSRALPESPSRVPAAA